jgi:hypothetical protein
MMDSSDPQQAMLIHIFRDYLLKLRTDTPRDALIIKFFDEYVHDSRAWFKLLGDSDDEWFGGGFDPEGKVRPSNRDKYRKKLEAKVARKKDPKSWAAIELALYEEWGDTLIEKGVSAQEALLAGAGYLRWRTVFYTLDTEYKKLASIAPVEIQAVSKQTADAKKRGDLRTWKSIINQQDVTMVPTLQGIKKKLAEHYANADPEHYAQCSEELDSALSLFGESSNQNPQVRRLIAELNETRAKYMASITSTESQNADVS